MFKTFIVCSIGALIVGILDIYFKMDNHALYYCLGFFVGLIGLAVRIDN